MSTISVWLDPYKEKREGWPCTACYPCMLQLGYAGGHCLVYNMDPSKRGLSCNGGNEPYGEGAYALLDGQGHGEDEFLFFKQKPVNLEKSTIGDYYVYNYDDYIEFANCDARAIYRKIQYAQKTFNFDPDNSYEEWMIEKAQKLIKAWEKKYKMTVEEYYKVFFEKQLAKVVAERARRDSLPVDDKREEDEKIMQGT